MRDIDRRSKFDRRVFLKGAASTVPAVAVATTTGLGVTDENCGWAHAAGVPAIDAEGVEEGGDVGEFGGREAELVFVGWRCLKRYHEGAKDTKIKSGANAPGFFLRPDGSP